MSEPKVEKSLADQRVDKILAEIKVLQEEMKKYEPPAKKETHSPSHFDEKDLETTCPDCKKKIDDFKQKVGEEYSAAHVVEHAQKLYKDRAILPHKCKECGLGVKEEELREPDKGCILCGNKQAR